MRSRLFHIEFYFLFVFRVVDKTSQLRSDLRRRVREKEPDFLERDLNIDF